MLEVELGVDDLVPDVGDPGAGHERQQEGVGHHVDQPQEHVRPARGGQEGLAWIRDLVEKEVRRRMRPMPLRMMKLDRTYLGGGEDLKPN